MKKNYFLSKIILTNEDRYDIISVPLVGGLFLCAFFLGQGTAANNEGGTPDFIRNSKDASLKI